jgi:hypothetical protein
VTLTVPRVPAALPASVRVPCRPALDSETPTAARRAAQKAAAAGWAVMLTYAAGTEERGTYVPDDDPASGRSKRLVRRDVELESIALRADGHGARRWLIWERERTPGASWKGVSGFGFDRDTPIHKLSFTGLEW